MAAYMHGNLAVQERQSPSQRVKIKETHRVKRRTAQLPTQEKLLYLFTVLICVIVAGVIIWRYAQIYQMNTKIHNIENQLVRLETENNALKEKISKLVDPEKLRGEAKGLGYDTTSPQNFVPVPLNPNKQSDDLALKP